MSRRIEIAVNLFVNFIQFFVHPLSLIRRAQCWLVLSLGWAQISSYPWTGHTFLRDDLSRTLCLMANHLSTLIQSRSYWRSSQSVIWSDRRRVTNKMLKSAYHPIHVYDCTVFFHLRNSVLFYGLHISTDKQEMKFNEN